MKRTKWKIREIWSPVDLEIRSRAVYQPGDQPWEEDGPAVEAEGLLPDRRGCYMEASLLPTGCREAAPGSARSGTWLWQTVEGLDLDSLYTGVGSLGVGQERARLSPFQSHLPLKPPSLVALTQDVSVPCLL